MFKKALILEYLGGFYEVNCGVDLGFLTHLFFRKMFELLTCKRNHNSPCGEFFSRESLHGSGSLTFSLSVFEEKSPYRVGRHVLNVFYLKDFVTWCLYQGKMRFFLGCYCLFF